MAFIIMQFSSSSCYFALVWSKYSPEHLLFAQPQSLRVPQCETKLPNIRRKTVVF
jgi:hypothetical protein